MRPSTTADRNAGPLSMEQCVFNDLFNIEQYLQGYEALIGAKVVADPEFVNWATQKFHPHKFDGTNFFLNTRLTSPSEHNFLNSVKTYMQKRRQLLEVVKSSLKEKDLVAYYYFVNNIQ